MKTIFACIFAVIALILIWWALSGTYLGKWIRAFWNLNIDNWVSAGWHVLALLTGLACLGMVVKILKSGRGLTP